MGDDEVSGNIRKQLVQTLDNMQSVLSNSLLSFNECVKQYCDSMQKSFDETATPYDDTGLATLHQNAKKQAVDSV